MMAPSIPIVGLRLYGRGSLQLLEIRFRIMV
jgi:hypothetical protein